MKKGEIIMKEKALFDMIGELETMDSFSTPNWEETAMKVVKFITNENFTNKTLIHSMVTAIPDSHIRSFLEDNLNFIF